MQTNRHLNAAVIAAEKTAKAHMPSEAQFIEQGRTLMTSSRMFTSIEKVAKRFTKTKYVLHFNWKKTIPSEEFPSESAALDAQIAYEVQHAETKKCWDILQFDYAVAEAKSAHYKAHMADLSVKSAAVARIATSEARKAIARMA